MHSLLAVKPGGNHDRIEVSADVQRLIMTGEFSNVGIKVEMSTKGLNVNYLVEPYFELRTVQITGARLIPNHEIMNMFKHQIGQKINLNHIYGTLAKMEKWYHEQGKDITFDILAVKENRERGSLQIKILEVPIEEFKLTTIYRSMRTDIVRMRIAAESEDM